MPQSTARSKELGELLRSRRERLQPAEVGLLTGPRRRVRGLRREEVAQLAAISPTYYTYLEQGREMRPSRQVLDSLSVALQLDAAERSHIHDLVHGAPPAEEPAVAESLAPAVVALVDRLDPCPAYVTGRCWDVLASNRAARALWTDWPAKAPDARNLLRWMFTDPGARQVMVDWPAEASALLGRFRSAAARHPGDTGFSTLLERLHTASPEVREWWPQHRVVPLSSGTKRLRHPALGVLELEHVVLQLADDPEQKLVTFNATNQDQARIAQLIRKSPTDAGRTSAPPPARE
ncbi:helix-turn-helix transcriptional regulator [Streptomyces sp. NBC_00727]|uniref:helix-turn-helix transcriptional regulator n=1 Tax=Streptomyces sp. NBC_00727 TaxID=2903675 RepID=UPI003868FA4C